MVPASFDPTKIRFVFLDRDGVVNRKLPEGRYVTKADELELLPGAIPAIARLHAHGCTVILVTNQRGISLGLYSLDDLAAIHQRLRDTIASAGGSLDAIYFCPHNIGECDCRKPGIALFHQAFADFPGAGAGNSLLIGDSPSDLEAAERLHMPAIFIRGDAATAKAGALEAESRAVAAFDSLAQAVANLLVVEGADAPGSASPHRD